MHMRPPGFGPALLRVVSQGGAAALAASALLALASILLEQEVLSLWAAGLLLVFIFSNLPRLRAGARVMLALALVVTAAFLLRGAGLVQLANIASKSVYLPALLVALSLLRLAAMQSTMVTEAGDYVVAQPPARRFLLLAAGAQIFGVLLNVGGLALLLSIALNGRAAQEPDLARRAIQERRIVSAAMRGFSANLYWSPLGLALNLILTLVPGVTWADFAPYGILASLAYMAAGWAVDRWESPSPTAGYRVPARGRATALLELLGILGAISLLAATAEHLLGIPLRGALLIVLPLFSILWVLAIRPPALPPVAALAKLGGDALGQMPRAANEQSIIFCAGYSGLVLGAMIPPALAASVLQGLHLSGGPLASVLCLAIFFVSVLGVNPMIGSTVLISAVIASGVAISPMLLLFSVLVAWSLSLLVSPMTSTVAIASAAANKPAAVIGLRWNGRFCAVILTSAITLFLLLG